MLENKRKAYVYRFVDLNDRTLYVGKCVNLDKRMKKHWSKSSHLKKQGMGDLYDKVQRIEYLECKTEYEALHKELDYITYYKPKYNTMSKIKEVIEPPDDLYKWKIYKVLKPISEQELKIRNKNEKLLPIFMLFLFIMIIINFII